MNQGPNNRPDSPYERIKRAILDGTFDPGSPLIEAAVAEWCGVSRTPVREALTRLEQDGVVTRTDRGVIVRERTPEEILDIYEIRITLEVTAARMAAERSTPVDLLRLERLFALTKEADPTDGAQLAERNRDFHRAVALASHSDALVDLYDRLNLHLMRYPETTLQYPGRWEEAHGEHRQLIDAISARDSDAAARAADKHFTTARDIRISIWQDGL